MIKSILDALYRKEKNLSESVRAQRVRISLLSQLIAILNSEQNSCKNSTH